MEKLVLRGETFKLKASAQLCFGNTAMVPPSGDERGCAGVRPKGKASQ